MTDAKGELIQALEEFADRLGRSPTLKDLERAENVPSHRDFIEVFGSWNAAKEAAGLETFPNEGRKDTSYTDEELLELLLELDSDVEGPASSSNMDAAGGYPSAMTYKRRFGSWNEARRRAGLDPITPGGPREYTDEELLSKLQVVAENTEGPVTKKVVDESDETPSSATYEHRFGSWNLAKGEAGLTGLKRGGSGRGYSYSDEELLQHLRRLARSMDGKVTQEDVAAADDCPSPTTYTRRFGSWSKAKEAAGID